MAESCRIENTVSDTKVLHSNESESFCIFNVFCVFISSVTILADLTTEMLVLAEYCKSGYTYWAVLTLLFLLAPNIVINVFSLRWIAIDKKTNGKKIKIRHWISHCCMVGLFERYGKFLFKIFSCQNLESMRSQKLFSQRNDLSLLHFLYSFTGTVPQIILQSYAITVLPDNHHTKVFSLIASTTSVIWACASYIYSIANSQNDNFQWNSVYFNLMWHFGMLIARISGIILFASIFGVWTFIPLGLHWTAMTFWIVTQKTTFCPNKIEETFYNVVMGFVYCFCYINLREGHTRYRILTFYSLIVAQNFGSLFLYILISDINKQKNVWSIISTICIVGGTIIGICGIILYYRWFHAKGPISWKNIHDDAELNNKVTDLNPNTNVNTNLGHVRSFKSLKHEKNMQNERIKDPSTNVLQTDLENADKKFLLEHWIARAGSPTFVSAPTNNDSVEESSIQIHTVENTPSINKINYTLNKSNITKTRKGISFPEVRQQHLKSINNMENSIDEITSSNLTLHKRRGIYSSDELKEDFNSIDLELQKINISESGKYNLYEIERDAKKTYSDSIDMDPDLSLSDINSSDINTFNENIVQKLCLSALKNIKCGNQEADIENIQKLALDILKEMYNKKANLNTSDDAVNPKQRDLDTPTESLSVHDYENICAVNIAREAWGLRSWNGYVDIENWLHDESVFRDRKLDTFTSASSEISSCISQELKQYLLSSTPFPKKNPTYCNVFVHRCDKNIQDDYVNYGHSEIDDTFMARPCLIENKDPNQLEPIMEEIDDLAEIDEFKKTKQINSESALVATIDEIRRATVKNSPRNLYHRREQVWDSPQLTNTSKIESNLKKALWKEPSKLDSHNTMKSLIEKENTGNSIQGSKLVSKINDLTISSSLSSLDTSVQENEPSSSCNVKRKRKQNNINSPNKNNNYNKPEEFQDFSNKDIDYLWKLVYDSSIPTSTSRNSTPTKNSNVKKAKNKPRRKFSILREKFEPKIHKCDDNLMHQDSSSPNHVSSLSSNVIQVKNHLDISERSSQSNEDPRQSQDKKINEAAENYVKGIKEKRTIFMKQILMPPKFNTKLRHKL